MAKAKGAKPMAHIPWHEFLYYDETSPTFIRHKTDKHNGVTVKRKAGDVAGTNNGEGYIRYVSSEYGNFAVHRIVWILHHGGDIPDNYLVDHIDGNIRNNNINNLRLVLEADNSRNAKVYSNNTSGKVGVYFDTKYAANGTPNYYWKAAWMELDGKQKTKCFSIKKLGMLEAQYAASVYRDEQIKKLNALGADYTDRHGT